jgi:thiamine pyrophosphate-dependent acetolactate synthase large subunit-like protein
MVHGTVGLLHSSMALFQAWADRVPVVLIVGHNRNPSGVINRPHSAQDMGLLVRSFVKYDDEATTLERFAESAMRAYRIAMTPPMGPVVLTVAAELQESIVTDAPRIPELTLASPPQGDAAAVRDEFDHRRRTGVGQFITREMILQRNPGRVEDLFRMASGIEITARRVSV